MSTKPCPHCQAAVEDTRTECGSCGTSMQVAAKDPNTGQIIDRKYRLVKLLGAGGMGMVYRAHHEVLRKDVAIKILSPAVSGDEKVRQRFLREAQITATLQHPNIVAALDAGIAGGRNLYIVMELVEGDSLAERLQKGPLAWPTAVRIAKEVAVALVCAHGKNLVHRDLKPANVMIEKGTERAKVLDFGIARVMEEEGEGTRHDLTRPGSGIGTLPYMSPEQLLGDKVDFRTDIYAFGVMLYEMLCGLRPLRAETQQRLFHVILSEAPPSVMSSNPNVKAPEWLEKLIFKCLEKERDKRPSTMQEVLQCLEQQCLPGQQKAPARPSGGGGTAVVRKGGGGKWVVIILFVLVAFAGIGYLGWTRVRPFVLGLLGKNTAVPTGTGNGANLPINGGTPAANNAPPANRTTTSNGVIAVANVPPANHGGSTSAEEEERRRAEEERRKREEAEAADKKRREEEAAKAAKAEKEEADRRAAEERRLAEARRVEEDRRKAELEAQGKATSAIRAELQELLAKRDLDGVLNLVTSVKLDDTARDLLNRDLEGWERIIPPYREATREDGSRQEHVERWERVRTLLPFKWTLPARAAEDYEEVGFDLYNNGNKDEGNRYAEQALVIDPARQLARRIRAFFLCDVKGKHGEAVVLLSPYLDGTATPDHWQENVLAWSRIVYLWKGAPDATQEEAVDRLSTLADDKGTSSARKARALLQRSWFFMRRKDYPSAAGDLMEALEQPENSYRADCHFQLSRVLWMQAQGRQDIQGKALENLEAAAKLDPQKVLPFVAMLDAAKDNEGMLTLARRLVNSRGLTLPVPVRFELCYQGARSGRALKSDGHERKGWLDESIRLAREANATDDAAADLYGMRGYVHYELSRFPEAKRDLASLRELVEKHRGEGGNWDALATNLKRLSDALANK